MVWPCITYVLKSITCGGTAYEGSQYIAKTNSKQTLTTTKIVCWNIGDEEYI